MRSSEEQFTAWIQAEMRRALALLAALVAASCERIFYSICSYDRKQHHALRELVRDASGMCEAGYNVTLRIYTGDGTAGSTAIGDAQDRDLRRAAACTRAAGGDLSMAYDARAGALKKRLTLEHRREFAAELENPSPGAAADDVFVFSEDDTRVPLRSVAAFRAAAARLARAPDGDRYVLGFHRYEVAPGYGAVVWENALPHHWGAVDVGGELYVLPHNVHAAAYAATRSELAKLAARCPDKTIMVTPQPDSMARLQASGWGVFHQCGRRKVLPARDFDAFFLRHLPDKNWWERSACASSLADVADRVGAWARRFAAGDRSFLCGDWWDGGGGCARDELEKVRHPDATVDGGRAAGPCGVVRNATSGALYAHRPTDAAVRRVAVERARRDAARDAGRLSTRDLVDRYGGDAYDGAKKENFPLVAPDGGPSRVEVRPRAGAPPPPRAARAGGARKRRPLPYDAQGG